MPLPIWQRSRPKRHLRDLAVVLNGGSQDEWVDIDSLVQTAAVVACAVAWLAWRASAVRVAHNVGGGVRCSILHRNGAVRIW